MAKRLFSWVLVLALVLSMVPAIALGVTAEEALDKHTSHEGWTEWTDKTKLPSEAGQYYLSVDVTLAGGWYPNQEIHLCLNGHDITQTSSGSRVLGVANGGVLSIYDCTGTTDENGIYTAGKLTGGSQTIGAGVNVNRGGVFNLYGGKIVGNHKAGTNGGGVYLQAATSSGKTAGMFNMYGGQICGNSSKLGAGVYVAGGLKGDEYTNAVFNMYGGIIGGYGEDEANVAEAEGGAIYACTYGTVNIQGGKIVGNKAKTGAGIWAKEYIVLNVANATFTGNESQNASAIYGQNSVQLTVKDTTITGNTSTDTSAEGYGAAVYMTGTASKVTLEGKTYIHDNTIANENIADLFINSTGDGSNEKVYVKDLNGYVKFGVKDTAASITEASQAVVFEGEPSTYAGASVSYMAGTEEKHVALVDGTFQFVTGHFHEGVEYTAWTEKAKLPSNGTYYLADNVTLTSTANRANISGGKTLRLCLNGHTVTHNIANAGSSESSELIRVQDASLYLDDCTTVYDENGYFVSGGKLMGANKKGNGSALYINKAAAIVEVTGVEFAKNNSTVTSVSYGGGAVMARYNTTPAKFVGCKFSENTAPSAGGAAMAMRDGGSVEAEKCYFYKNTAKEGGAIYVYESKLSLKDCLFEENSATGSSGAIGMATDTKKTTTNTVVIDSCTMKNNSAANAGAMSILGVSNVTIQDTTITGNTNTSTAGYGAVNLGNSNAVVKIQGDTVIYDNLNKEGKQQNLHAQQYEGVDYDLSGLGAKAKIGVSLIQDRIDAGFMYFSTTGMTAVPAGVTSDNDTYEVYVDDQGRLALKEKSGSVTPPPVVEGHTHKLCNDNACTAHGDAITFEAWTDSTTLPTSGNYYLDVDVNLTAAVENTGDLNLCLNGHTVKQTTSGKRLLGTKKGFALSVTDCGTTGQLTGGTATYGSAISVRHGSVFNLFAGKITGNSSESEGTVYIQGGKINADANEPAGGVFNMYGGEISDNTAKVGAAVSMAAPVGDVTTPGTLNIYGGKLADNTTTGRGGAINASGTAIIYIENAEISGNTTGGEGTIYATTGPTLTVKNTTIENNNAKSAAAISTYGGTVTLDGAVIRNNHATDTYTAVHCANSGAVGNVTLTLKGATVITKNTSGADKVPMNLYLRNNVAVDVSGLTDAAKIGLSRHSDRAQDRVSKAPLASANELARFESDDVLCSVDQDAEGYLVLLQGGAHTHKLCNDAACTAHGGDVSFKKWTATDSLPTSGAYYLDVDVNLTAVSYAEGDLVICLNGHTIKQTKTARILQTKKGSTLTITDCGTTGTLSGGRNNTGSGIFIAEGTTFNLYGGKITDCGPSTTTSTQAGAAIFLRSTDGPNATFNMYGGEITGNGGAKSWAGAITNASGNANNYVYVNIYGGKIYGNTAGTGGALRMEKKSVTTIYGGEIYGNEATTNGGAIYLSTGSPELVIKGGKIYDNTATNGGAIYASSGAKITLEGDVTIYNNTASDKQNNLYLAGDDVITLGAMADNAKVGVGAATANRAITTTNDTDYSTNFLPDNGKLTVSYKEKALWLEKIEVSDHYHAVCADVVHGNCEHDKNQMWIKWGDDEEEKTTLPTTSGYYYLTQDIQMSANVVMQPNQSISLCLNGKTVTAADKNRHFALEYGTVMNITDCTDAPGGLTGGSRAYGGSINVVAGSTLNLYAGKIYGNTAPDSEGAGLYAQAAKVTDTGIQRPGGVINMYGGEICGNKAGTGAGIRLAGQNPDATGEPAQFNMYGGSIHDNEAVHKITVDPETQKESKTYGYGGGVAANNKTVINLYGGEICSNSADEAGGGLYINAETDLLIEGGKIRDNSSTATGGGIFATGKGTTITMNGGEISGNKAANGGGLITQTQSVFTMNGGSITGNVATSGGGGAYISTNTDFIMNGGVIEGNYAKGSGAGFYALRSRVTLDNGAVVQNNTAGYRAGAFASSGATVVLNKVTISGNTAKEGGAAYINRTSSGSGENIKYYPSTVTVNDGALITGNKGESNCGGLLIANDDVVVTMNGGEISKNTSANGGGVMTWRGSTFILKGGKITNHNLPKGSGGAIYVSTASTFRMEGGTVSNNTAKSAGAIYVLRAQADFIGGTVSYNRAQHTSTWKDGKETKSGGTGGAMYISGAKVNFKGTSFVGNYSSVNGGAIMMGRASYTENGVKKVDNVTVNVSAGLFSGNKTEGAGGAMLIQSEFTVVNVYGGTFTDNEANNAGAIYVSTKTNFNMSGGTITRNHAKNTGGALYFLKSNGKVTGGQIYNNTASTSGGGIVVSGDIANVVFKNMKIHDHTAKTAGFLAVQSYGHFTAENCDFYDNLADGGTGGAGYISNNSYGDFVDCKFYNNKSSTASGALHAAINSKVNITRCDFTENYTDTNGGAMYSNPKCIINITDSTFSKNVAKINGGALVCRSTMRLTNVTIENCSAEYGGAIATDTNNTGGAGVLEGLTVKNSKIRNNTAAQQGGAFYIWKGRPLHLHDSVITGNTAGAEGGAIWSYEDVELHGTKITGNTSGGEGFAVYMNDANYDGHSYYTSKNKLSGNTIVKDNQGGDLWMGPDVAFAITAEGLGEDAHIELTMDSGFVTNRVLGIYHYEGGNQVYTITYGDRSMTDPEYDASLAYKGAETQTGTDVDKKETSGDTWLYVGIGLIAVLIIAVVVILVVKKKKAGNAAEKASK